MEHKRKKYLRRSSQRTWKRSTMPNGSCGAARSCGLEVWTESRRRYGPGREVGAVMGVGAEGFKTWGGDLDALLNFLSSLSNPQNVFFWKIILVPGMSESFNSSWRNVSICPPAPFFLAFFPPLHLKMLLLPIYLLCKKCLFLYFLYVDRWNGPFSCSLSLLLSKLSQSLIPCRWM